jgi:hypothetical protein
MERVDEVVAGYCRRIGATPPEPGQDGAYVLRFEQRVAIRLSGEGRDRVLLRADLPPLKRDRNRLETLQRLMRVNLLLTGRKRATLTLDNAADTPFLYDVLTVGPAEVDSSHRLITTFVNEVTAFHKALDRVH